ncbi:MAG: hypothetical protein AKCLJLPJ_02010 [Fimbriimonadales bacterium]|nr:hypothetical protein [Fimbriimonadales bacterium]
MFGGRWCIGALTLDVWASARLVTRSEDNGWPNDTPFEIGQVWDIEGRRPGNLRRPHTENFLVKEKRLLGEYGPNLARDIVSHVAVARGGTDALYEGCLRAIPSGSLRVVEGCVPTFSTQFWVPDRELRFADSYFWIGNRKVKFVGAQLAQTIRAGSLVRMSLSGWFTPKGHAQEGCYLQLSGWWDPPNGRATW